MITTTNSATSLAEDGNTPTNMVTTFNEENKTFTRVDNATGRSWTWALREKPKKKVYQTRNGLTVEKLSQAGNSVRVKHFRWALYGPHIKPSKHSEVYRAVVVPSIFRLHSDYGFLPKGGYTHIVIKDKVGKLHMVSSECSTEDPFCYAAGVAAALDRLPPEKVASLLA